MPTRRKRKQGSEVDDDGDSVLRSERPDPRSEEECSDIDVESPTSTFNTVPQKGRKRGREVDDDGCSDPKKRPDPYVWDGSSDADDESPETSRAKRPSSKKKRGKRNKAEKKKDLIVGESPEISPAKRPSSKKKTGKQNKAEKKKEPPKVKVRRPWSEAERKVVEKHLGKFMAERRVPGKEDCMRCINEGKVLGQRSWKDVKDFVRNTIVTLNTRSASRKLKH
ncbi:hypothetical protein D9C73_003332 [Collichthys lucidus]|uniref:Uncharacterized protein n=1 Tax=Collichthys lucidus TaxID=240159 RepID=A0A4U5U653_COLLU|nr:hypothetical protein D9C73_003332 [Collichthys lucidus]